MNVVSHFLDTKYTRAKSNLIHYGGNLDFQLIIIHVANCNGSTTRANIYPDKTCKL